MAKWMIWGGKPTIFGKIHIFAENCWLEDVSFPFKLATFLGKFVDFRGL